MGPKFGPWAIGVGVDIDLLSAVGSVWAGSDRDASGWLPDREFGALREGSGRGLVAEHVFNVKQACAGNRAAPWQVLASQAPEEET